MNLHSRRAPRSFSHLRTTRENNCGVIEEALDGEGLLADGAGSVGGLGPGLNG